MLPNVTVSIVPVIVAAVAANVLGALWYSPLLFGKAWMSLVGMKDKDIKKAKEKGMGKLYLINFLGTLVLAYILSLVIGFSGASGVDDAIYLSFLVWLGFYATSMLGSILWESKPVKLYMINVVYYLVALEVMGVILVSMS